MDAEKLESLVKRLEAAVVKLERGGGGGGAGPSGDGDGSDVAASPAYLDYCAWADDSVKTFVTLSDALGEFSYLP